MRKIFHYLNPISQLGSKNYSYVFPFLTTLITAVILELIVNLLHLNPQSIGALAIFLFVTLIIYFSFRDGIIGGSLATIVTVFFYLYLIYTLHYHGAQLISGLETTVILGIIYFILSFVIGGLKQTIDSLIEKEADGRRRLEAIIQQLPVGVLITDSSGKIMQGNKQADEILGLKVPIGFDATKKVLVPTRENGKFINPTHSTIFQTLAKNKPIVGREFDFMRNDGKKMYMQVNSSTIQNSKGKVVAAAIIMNDITEQKEQEARKDDFVNMASHELKTPLTTMKLYNDLLLRRINKYNEQDKKIIENTKIQIQRLQELINDLLDVSRLQTGKLTLKKETFRLDLLIHTICEDLQPTAKQTIRITKSIRLLVNADKFRIYQVLTNLIINAVKYSPPNSEIRIRLERKDGKAIVSIQDFGLGIAKSQQKKIFQRLYQIREAKGSTYPGFGMGLYISKEIIQRHSGKIWTVSNVGEGSIFYFSLPLTKK